jgi:ATP-dependent Lhr-like helicase
MTFRKPRLAFRMESRMANLLEAAPPSVAEETALGVLRLPIRTWFAQRFGSPTTIQRAAWQAISAGKSVLLSAPTGSGKTLAAFLPLLDALLGAPPVGSVRVLYVSPLKALAADVRRNLRSYLAGIAPFLAGDVRLPQIALRTGDTSQRDRRQLWLSPPDILLTTPESLALLLTHEGAEELFGGLRQIVVDEVHALAPGKRGADLSVSLERLGSGVQRIGLSATATPLEEVARYLVGEGRACVLASAQDAAPLELTLRPLPAGVTFLSRLLDLALPELEANRSTLIFTNTRALAERLTWALRRRLPQWDDRIAVHHSSLAADRRRRVERRLKRGRLRTVVTSTSLELGIDIGSVDLVVLVHPPGDVVRLLQRVGRAGHAPGQPRRGLVLTAGPDELLEAAVTASSGVLGQHEPLSISAHPLDVLCQQLLGMASTRTWQPDSAFELICRASPYRELSRQDFDACLDYLSGRAEVEDCFVPRLLWEDGAFRLRDERTLRILRQNLGTILAEETCEIALAEPDPLRTPRLIGDVDAAFAERLQPGDRFLLGGLCLQFRRLERAGGRAGAPRLVVEEVAGRPRVPRWAGGGWPMSPQLAERLYVFRGRAAEALRDGPKSLAGLLRSEYGLLPEAVEGLVSLFALQETVSEIPDPDTLLVEIVPAQSLTTCYLHTPLNRRGNDALARVATLRLGRTRTGQPLPASLVADLGLALYLRGGEPTPEDFRALLSPDGFEEDLRAALSDSLVLRERFQQVALTGLLLLRNPLGSRRRVGGHDWGGRRLFDQIQARWPEFVLLRQAAREVGAEVCDANAARAYLAGLPRRTIRSRRLSHPSPFVESWTQAEPAAVGTPPTPEELLRQLHATLTERDEASA